jgi:hypothetical protein
MKFIIFFLAFTIFSVSHAKDNKHQIGVFTDYSVIHGKPAGFAGVGIGADYHLNFHKYFSWRNELVFNHGFRIGYNSVEYGDAEIIVNVVKKDPLSTNNILLSSYLAGHVYNKNNSKLSVGLGLTGRVNFDRSKFYYGINELDPITGESKILNYFFEKKSVSNFGWGLITNISYSYQIKNNIMILSELGWRGYIGEVNDKNYQDRASGSSMMYVKLGCVFSLSK